jgi:hypothetical protein
MQAASERAIALQLLKATVAGLIRRMAVGQIVLRSTGAQDPRKHGSRFGSRRPRPPGRRFGVSSGLSFSRWASVRSGTSAPDTASDPPLS